MKSTVTSKSQTTVPREIRRRLGVGPGDTLTWEWVDGAVRVERASQAFLALRGSVPVGRGSVVEDVREARTRRGSE